MALPPQSLSPRDASILGLIARAKSKDRARELLVGLAPDSRQAGQLLLGDITEEQASERARALAKTVQNWVNASRSARR